MKRTTFKATPNPFFAALLSRRMALSMAALVAPSVLFAGGPTGESVVSGEVTVDRQTVPNRTIVNQSANPSNSAIVNWNSFDVSSGHTVQFAQPNSSSVILNRVVAGSASQIFGNIEANGRVFIVNPQGVMFGQGSQVDVGGLVASTLNISDSDFTAGRVVLQQGTGSGNVVNSGTINTTANATGGFIVLASANEVTNNGSLKPGRLGDVVLASGNKMTLDLDGSGLVSFVVNEATVSAYGGVSNAGEIIAQGGMVLMTAHTNARLIEGAVNNSGRIEAKGITENGGDIFLTAAGSSGADVVNSGTLDASAEEGFEGGDIEIRADGVIDINNGFITGRSLTLDARAVYIEASELLLTGAFKATSRGGDIEILGNSGYGYGGGYGAGFSQAYGGDYGTSIVAQTLELSATDGDIFVSGSNLGYVVGRFMSQEVATPDSAGIYVEDSLLQGRNSHGFNTVGDIEFSNSIVTGAPEGDTPLVLGQFSAVMGGDFLLAGGSSILASRIGITGLGTSGVGSEVTLDGNLTTQGLLRINTVGGVYGGRYNEVTDTTSYISIHAGALNIQGSEININGDINVGTLSSGAGIDPLLLQLVALGAPETLPESLAPNVSLIATDPSQDGIYIDSLSMSGDYLYVKAPNIRIHQLNFDSTLFFNFDSIKPVINLDISSGDESFNDVDFDIISNTLENDRALIESAPKVDSGDQGLTVALGSSSYAGDIVFGPAPDAGNANILYLTTGTVTNADRIVTTGRVVDLDTFRPQLPAGEIATNTQVTSQLQDSVTSEGESDTGGIEGSIEGDVENKSTKEDEEGELTCS